MHRLGDRLLLRGLALLASRQIVAIHGLKHIRPACDPFILVANHSTRREAILVPAMLFLLRGGRVVHFLADWNFRLIPGVGVIYSRAQVVTVTRKSARPRFLNVLKPLYGHHRSSMERTKALLAAGRSIGVFPKAPPIARPPSYCAGVAALPGCRWRRACPSYRWASALPASTRRCQFPETSNGALHWRTPAAAEPRWCGSDDERGGRVAFRDHDGDRAALGQGVEGSRQGGRPMMDDTRVQAERILNEADRADALGVLRATYQSEKDGSSIRPTSSPPATSSGRTSAGSSSASRGSPRACCAPSTTRRSSSTQSTA